MNGAPPPAPGTARTRGSAVAAPPAPPAREAGVEPRTARAALLLALVLVLVWGSNFSVQKQLFDTIGPLGFLFARYLVMPLCALLLLWQRYGLRWPRLSRGELWALARLGLLGHVLHIGLATFGVHWSTAFSSSVILACGPIFTLLLLRALGVETLSRAQVLGVAVACAGVLVFLSDKLLGGRWQAGGGDLVLLVAAACFSAYTVAAKPLIERHGGVVVMAYATLFGSAPLLLASLPSGLRVPWAELPLMLWAGLAYAIVLAAFVGWLVWGWVNAVRGVARTAPLVYLMPPVAGVVAWLATGEQFTPIKLGGAAITLLGVALAQFAARRRQPDAVMENLTVVD